MTGSEAEKLGFKEWTTHYEKEQEADRKKVNQLTEVVSQQVGIVGALTADVRTLIENQKGMFSRINRPVQWGVMVSAGALVAVVLTLVTTPMKDDINHMENAALMEQERSLGIHMGLREKLDDTKAMTVENATNIEWLIKMEERVNRRIHNEPNN